MAPSRLFLALIRDQQKLFCLENRIIKTWSFEEVQRSFILMFPSSCHGWARIPRNNRLERSSCKRELWACFGFPFNFVFGATCWCRVQTFAFTGCLVPIFWRPRESRLRLKMLDICGDRIVFKISCRPTIAWSNETLFGWCQRSFHQLIVIGWFQKVFADKQIKVAVLNYFSIDAMWFLLFWRQHSPMLSDTDRRSTKYSLLATVCLIFRLAARKRRKFLQIYRPWCCVPKLAAIGDWAHKLKL